MSKKTPLDLSSEESSQKAFNPVINYAESLFLALFNSSAHLAIEAMDNTQQVLDQVDLLARRLNEYKQHLDEFGAQSRKHLKLELLSLCHDSTELGIEAVKGGAQVLRAALDELQDLQEQGKLVFKDVLEPNLDFSNPFRKTQKSSRKEPTIIPISIQEN